MYEAQKETILEDGCYRRASDCSPKADIESRSPQLIPEMVPLKLARLMVSREDAGEIPAVHKRITKLCIIV